ncbi:(RS)-norcoclaurine 6-O-methyltransferase-like [Tasmannia lanceolata]|uniref:(RS)-norcoclaurine 6-O-methyltransferase-like n=1 Tax=Tasmannia lanceolata TaxID=3420 RepID=UPI004064C6F5
MGEEFNDLAIVWGHIVAFLDSAILKWALDLGIADIIQRHGGPTTLSQLSSSLPMPAGNSDNLRRLMCYLVHMGLLSSQAEDLYWLTLATKFILSDEAKSLVPFARLTQQGDPNNCLELGPLLEEKGSKTTFEALNGEDLWSYAAKHAEFNKLFNEAMASNARIVMPALIDGCRDVFQGNTSLVDIGGGTGTTLRAIAKAFPFIKCSVLDLPHVIETIPNYPEVEQVELLTSPNFLHI